MLRPTPGELLGGIRRQLEGQVLPALADGAAARQLRAALHALARIERSWDLLPTYAAEDNADLRATLRDLGGPEAVPVGGGADGTWPGVNDPALAALLRDNHSLSAELERAQTEVRGQPVAEATLLALHGRMAARARRAAGLPDDRDG